MTSDIEALETQGAYVASLAAKAVSLCKTAAEGAAAFFRGFTSDCLFGPLRLCGAGGRALNDRT